MTNQVSVQIGEHVSKAQTWSPAREAPDQLFNYIDIGSVSQTTKSIIPNGTILGSDAPSRARQLIQAGDVLASTVRPNLNAVAYVGDDMDGATASTGFCVLRPESERLDGRYLYHWVMTSQFVEEMVRQATGQSYPAVSDKIVKSSLIPLPSLDEQKRIAGILDQADALRRLRAQALDNLNTLGQAIFHEMFGAFENDFGGWPVSRIDEVLEDAKIGFVRGSKDMSEEFPVPYLRMDSIESGGGLRLADLKRVNASAKELNDYALKKGDLLFNTRNSRELVGKTAVVWEEFDGVYNNNILRCRFKNDMTGAFLDAFLRIHKGRRLLDAVKSGTTNVFAIYQKSFMALTVPCPPRDLQQQFSDRLELVAVEHKKLKFSLNSISALFSSLQNRAFKGEL